MSQMGNSAFAQMKQKQSPLPKSAKATRYVRCITERLLKAMGENPQSWKIEVFGDKSPNAFALPGKNMGVHTGMIDLSQNQDQLAAVIGHEIGHVLAHHGNERATQQMLMQGGLAAADIFYGQKSKTNGLVVSALGLGAQFGVLLPFSRKHETEADELGIRYMAKAGFDPREAAELWKLMKKSSAGAPPEFLSTHPSAQSRIQNLTGKAKGLLSVYDSVNDKPRCTRS